MAEFNEILVGRYNRLLQRLTGIKGDNPSPQLSGDIVPILAIEVDRPEWAYLAGEALYSVFQNQAAVAAQSARFQLRNPSGSGVLAIVEGAAIWSSSAGQEGRLYRGMTPTVDLTGTTQGVAIDSRFGSPLRSACIASVDTNASVFATGVAAEDFPFTSADAGIIQLHRRPNRIPIAILGPGSACGLFSVVVNNQALATWFWRERAIEPGENFPS